MRGLFIVVIAFAVGFSLAWFWGHDVEVDVSQRSVPVASLSLDVAPMEPKISSAELQDHRESNYQDLETVDQVAKLPTDFSQTEALYTVAGRADISELQTLILQAASLANRFDRSAALQILFLRYVELDPPGALDYLEAIDLDIDIQVISSSFYSWAKVDLNMAIDTANSYNNPQRRRIAGQAILRATSELYPSNLKAVSQRLVDTHNIDSYQARALAASANTAPYLAIEEALSLSNVNLRQQTVFQIATVWARANPEQALAYADGIADLQLKQQFTQSILSRWLSDDPEAATARVTGLPESPEKEQLMIMALSNLGAQDPSAAMGMADQLNLNTKYQAYNGIFRTWAHRDVRAAVDAASNLSDASMKQQVISSIAHQYVAQFPEEALNWAQELPLTLRDNVLENVLTNLAASNPKQALNFVAATQIRSDLLAPVLMTIARSQPKIAAQFAEEMPEGYKRKDLVSQIASQWVNRDPEAAFNWVAGFDGETYQQTMQNIGQNLSYRDPDQAARYLHRVRGAARDSWIVHVASGYAQRDPQRALNWVEQFKGDAAYSQALSNVIPALARRDPVGALRLAQNVEGVENDYLVSNVVQQWARTDLQSATRWLESASPELQSKSAPGVVQAWARRDFSAAKNWTMRLPKGQSRDMALVSMIQHAPNDNQAEKLMASLDSSEMKDNAVLSLFYKRLGQNPARARAFMKDQDVSPHIREQMETLLRNPQRFGVGQ